jgi:predicted ribosome quality control (RQC) complex YloA/Tae2 family protein
MDVLLLQAIVSEAAGRLIEQEILRVGFLGRHRYVLRFASPDRDNLLVSVRPDLPRLHLTPAGLHLREAPPDRFAAMADREISGGRLIDIRTPGDDRVAVMRFRVPRSAGGATERLLVAELFGRSSNLLLLDGSNVVLAFAREIGSVLRAPVAGAPYEDPKPSPRRPPAAGEDPAGSRAAALRPAAASGGLAPTVYSSKPLADFRDGDRVGQGDLRPEAAPLDPPPLGKDTGEPLIATPVATASGAAQTAYDLLERLRDFGDERERHRTQVRREAARLAALESRLGEDLAGALASGRDRRRAEALLAGLADARVAGHEAVVPDPESVDGATLTVPIDPALSLPENAQRLFTRWKKGKRAVAVIETRLAAVRRRLTEWRALEPLAMAAASEDDLRALRAAMDRLGLVQAERPVKRAPTTAPRAAPTRVRRHTTSDGFVVLVGRSGPENDTLTFKVASPWDFWMHAAGTPGAHVVVRNPQRLRALPEGPLRIAAAIAAWYSGAKEEGKVEVHYTQRKHVHKRRGMPAGQVLVRKFRTIQVAPRLPQPAIEDV